MIELFQVFKEGVGTSIVYGKAISLNGTLIYYTPQDNIVTISEPLEKAIDAKLIGFEKPVFLERVPNAIGEYLLERSSGYGGRYLTSIKTTINPKGKLELMINIEEEIKDKILPKDHFCLKIGDQFDYDLLKGNKIK